MTVTITIPDLTDEQAQEEVDSWRRYGWTPETVRTPGTLESLFQAALMEQYPPKPVLTVGELAALTGGAEVEVVGIDGGEAWVRHGNGYRCTWASRHLTPLGVPAPEGWGES